MCQQKHIVIDRTRQIKGRTSTVPKTGCQGTHDICYRGTQKFLKEAGVDAQLAYWPEEKKSPNTIELIRSREVDLVINIPKNLTSSELNNGYKIRRSAVDFNVPLITNARLASAFISAFCRLGKDDLIVKSWDEYR